MQIVLDKSGYYVLTSGETDEVVAIISAGEGQEISEKLERAVKDHEVAEIVKLEAVEDRKEQGRVIYMNVTSDGDSSLFSYFLEKTEVY